MIFRARRRDAGIGSALVACAAICVYLSAPGSAAADSAGPLGISPAAGPISTNPLTFTAADACPEGTTDFSVAIGGAGFEPGTPVVPLTELTTGTAPTVGAGSWAELAADELLPGPPSGPAAVFLACESLEGDVLATFGAAVTFTNTEYAVSTLPEQTPGPPSNSPEATATPEATPDGTPQPEATPAATPGPSPTPTPDAAPTPSPAPSVTVSADPSASPGPPAGAAPTAGTSPAPTPQACATPKQYFPMAQGTPAPTATPCVSGLADTGGNVRPLLLIGGGLLSFGLFLVLGSMAALAPSRRGARTERSA
jgi:hypothetical protein